MKEAVKQREVLKKKVTEVFINGKNTVPVDSIHKFKRHGGSAFHGIFVAASRAKAAVAAERNKLKLSTVWTAVHGTAKRWVTTVDHFFHVFNDRRTWVQGKNNFFVMVFENIL